MSRAGNNLSGWEPLPIPALGGPFHAAQELCVRYGFSSVAEVQTLYDVLCGYSTRDMLPGWTKASFTESRNAASAAIDSMRDQASCASKLLAQLIKQAREFEEEFEYNPSIMEQITGIDMGPPSDLSIPDELTPIHYLLEPEEYWQGVRARLDAVANFPRIKVNGSGAHIVLQKAVAMCHRFWRDQGRSWKDSMLDVMEPGDTLNDLTEQCDQFLFDILYCTGFEFSVDDLRIAFTSKRQVKGRTAP
ncbi:hypothetical protein [Sphingobium fluviale]|uniref:Uncharacterized protein n=1 Tax=Sphingobium fluviale TaxID=2506423 RepID=A0A4V1N3A9_9SPHN|nr:hypothetical protein [Sphingobium fluviale]RXR27588.1 hypothetical protein EQG66_11985 [Sphingobium fluviale]